MQIRKSIFETNSSSTHSVVVDGGTDYEVPEIKEDIIVINGNEFGWGYEQLKKWKSKAEYCATYAFLYGREKDVTLLKQVIEDYTNKKVVFNVDKEDHYIDHQSIDSAEEAFAEYASLKNLIFGKESYITIDNDNH